MLISITGPESSGKTTLSEQLAVRLGAIHIPEYARTYLERTGGSYEEIDLLRMADWQIRQLQDLKAENKIVILDTDLLVLEVWSEWKYDRVHPRIKNAVQKYHADRYLLCSPVFPWRYDPLRENPHDQDVLYGIYKSKLEEYGFPFAELKGDPQERLEKAVSLVIKDKG